jgi:hypothetical protein
VRLPVGLVAVGRPQQEGGGRLASACCRSVAAWHRPPHQYLLKYQRGWWQRGARAGGRGGLVLHRVGTHRGIRHGEPVSRTPILAPLRGDELTF